MKQNRPPRLIDDFVTRPSAGSASGHPDAARFPNVGMTLSAYGTQPVPQRAPIIRADSSSTRPTSRGPQKQKAAAAGAKAPAASRGRWQRLHAQLSWKRTVLILGIIVLLVVGWLGFKFLYNLSKTFGGNIFGLFNSTKLHGEDRGRVNILLAGNSSDDPGHDGANLTDSIMLLSIDTKDHTAFMLSIPRDLWVDIPTDGYEKINATYEYGQANKFSQEGYPAGGMGQLEQIVQQDFGLPIDYYALIDYSALRDAVNAVGGIDVTINSDDPRGLYDPSTDWTTGGVLVNLSNGKHHLNGEQALDLARARGDAYGSYGFPQADFDRTQHQREMIVALKDKVMSAGVLANPLKLSNLFDTLGAHVHTDMTVSEAHRLYDLTKKIGNSAIKSVSLNDANGQNLLASYQTSTGQAALIPAAGVNDYSQIQNFIKQLTSNNPVVHENANVVLLNASNTYGLAQKNKDTLTAKGITVTAMGDAPEVQSTTTIIEASKAARTHQPSTLAILKGLYGSAVTTTNPYARQYPDADFIVVLGTNQGTP